MYQMITLGGDAELELVDSLDPFSEGIVFSVFYLFNTFSICLHHSFTITLPGEAAQEVLEEHQQPLRRGEDLVLVGARVRSPLLQTHPTLRHGRDRRCLGLQECLHCGQLRQGADQECAVHHHFPEVEFNWVASMTF